MKNKETTKEKAIKSLQERLNWLDELLESEEEENLSSYILSVNSFKKVVVELSWGGPSDGFILEFDKDNELVSAKYYWANWGEYYEEELNEEEFSKVDGFLCIDCLADY